MTHGEQRAAWRVQIPWRQPTSFYDNDGPAGETTFTVGEHSFRVAPTGAKAFDTGRSRYLVCCESCELTLHKSTTSATIRIEDHLELWWVKKNRTGTVHRHYALGRKPAKVLKWAPPPRS
jgi:hypothetical protein